MNERKQNCGPISAPTINCKKTHWSRLYLTFYIPLP